MGVSTNSNDRWRPQSKPSQNGTVFMGWPVEFSYHEAWNAPGPRIAIGMFESSVLPAGWSDTLNLMDAVITPSRFCHEVFIEAGVTRPIYRIPLGIGDVYQPYKRMESDVLIFLAIGDRGLRKGGQEAIQAFQMAFGNDSRYRLIIKTRAPQTIKLFPGGNIEVIQQDMSEHELYELYCKCDVMISANRGEGFGLLPREFAATGGIALATDWGGTADDIDKWGWPLSYELQPADWSGQPGLEGQSLGMWAAPCVDELSEILQDIARYREEFTHVAYHRAGNVHKLYSWRAFAQSVYEIWQGCL